ncbi:MAG: RNA methyltransferase [Candidatus Parcubacteria bacterium]|nr:RNA methyltransferase [Burkholderiales bacterium]
MIASRGNPRVRRWRELARDAAERRKERCAVIEGAHLVGACLEARFALKCVMLSESAASLPAFSALAARSGKTPVLISDAVFRHMADTESPAGIAAEIALPSAAPQLSGAASCVLLDAVQDAGNVGAILRSASAFGIRHAVLGRGCADAWSPKVLRAGMGAHFSIAIQEAADLDTAIERFGGKVACMVPREGIALDQADLGGRIGWLLGAEGRGVSAPLMARAALKVTIPMPGSAESLNVAAAAAICFYEFSRRAAPA